MQSGVQICNTDTVVELEVYVLSTDGIDPLEVHLDDTISDIKERVCDEVAKQIGKTFACEPELFMMLLFPECRVLDNDSSKTLRQVLINVGILNDGGTWEGSESLGISLDSGSSADDLLLSGDSQCGEQNVELISNRVLVVQLYPTGTDFGELSGKEEDCMEYHEDFLDEVCIYPKEEIVILDPEDAFSVKRPDDDILPGDTGTFRVLGEIFAYRNTDHGEKKRYIPSDGFTYPFEQVTKLSTSASLVLLAFNSANLDVIEEFTSRMDNPSDILLLQVSWDKFSYLFLRKLRQDLGPHVPIVAVTDLDVRHLDLLAFLDTLPCDLPKLYGWSLSQDCAHLGVNHEDVDIKWLGIRPSDSDAASDYNGCFAKASRKLPHDFKVVYDFLLGHPRFSRKSKWVQELQVIADRQLHRSLPYLWQGLHWYAKSFAWENYLPMKIANKDWI
ncbi:uncharacterized protein LOC141655774 [Silene latifolia]|uniref:uncharacterized protein LOC141655774 n=1 Tax=Silene latifolia TaxID=37657 RepID=UPI003D772B0B